MNSSAIRSVFPFLSVILLTALMPQNLPAAESQRRPLPIVDQAAKDSSFLAFRNDLQAAIRSRDASVVYAALSPELFYSFPPYRGHEGFAARLQLQERSSQFWGVLDTLLSQGGGFIREGLFAAPYVPFTWPAELDGEAFVAATATDAPVYKTPDEKSPAAGKLSWEIVRLVQPWQADPGWVKVAMPDGGEGYLAKRFCRGAVDWRAGFEKQPDGSWKIKFFLGRD